MPSMGSYRLKFDAGEWTMDDIYSHSLSNVSVGNEHYRYSVQWNVLIMISIVTWFKIQDFISTTWHDIAVNMTMTSQRYGSHEWALVCLILVFWRKENDNGINRFNCINMYTHIHTHMSIYTPKWCMDHNPLTRNVLLTFIGLDAATSVISTYTVNYRLLLRINHDYAYLQVPTVHRITCFMVLAC